jgi:hypothetical protein
MRANNVRLRLLNVPTLTLLIAVLTSAFAAAQDIPLHVTYTCAGEHIYIDGCNIRDLSDTATCSVVHPDHVGANRIAAITSETRGSLKKRLPACVQPTAQQLAAEQAREKKQQQLYDAAVQKANPQPPPAQAQGVVAMTGQPAPPKNEEERAMRRCVSSGRLPATCTGNSLLGAFGQMLGSVLPSAAKEPAPGPDFAGVFEGPGKWRLDFIDGGVLVNCSFLSPNQESYSIDFRNSHTVLTVHTTPKPLVLTLTGGETITGPGPVTIDGVVATGTKTSGPDPNASSGYTDRNGMSLTNSQAASSSEVYQGASRHYGSVTPSGSSYTTFAHRQATCPALNLSSKGASVGAQTMQTDLLKSMFSDGDKGAPTPPGIRMHGIYAAPTGFSVQFFPESAVLGCGPDAARAYPYTVEAEANRAVIHIAAPDKPLLLALGANNSLEPSLTGPYQVHGRVVVGQNDNDDFTFRPLEQTCTLATLAPSKTIPSTGGAAVLAASATNPSAPPSNNNGRLSTPAAPLGNATLSISSGLPPQPGLPNALAGRPYVLLRDSYGDALAKGGVVVPSGTSPYKYVASVCAPGQPRSPACQKTVDAINASAASAVRADGNGNGILPGVPPATYYLMISTIYNKQPLTWGQSVQLKAGANTVTLDPRNALPPN